LTSIQSPTLACEKDQSGLRIRNLDIPVFVQLADCFANRRSP
jgi:hypothetical protein